MEHHHEAIEFSLYFWHYIAGLVFAATGAYASRFCEHVWHRIFLAMLLVAVETMIVVTTIG